MRHVDDPRVWWSPDDGCWIGTYTRRTEEPMVATSPPVVGTFARLSSRPLAATDPKDPGTATHLFAAVLGVPAKSIRVSEPNLAGAA